MQLAFRVSISVEREEGGFRPTVDVTFMNYSDPIEGEELEAWVAFSTEFEALLLREVGSALRWAIRRSRARVRGD